MKLYRTRPIVVEAEMFDGTLQSGTKIAEWCEGRAVVSTDGFGVSLILLQEFVVEPGSYVVKDTTGEFRVVPPVAFGSTYEPVLEL